VHGALDALGLAVPDIDHFVLPHLGARRMSAAFFTPFGIDPERSTWPWSRTVGHLGAGDQFAGLAWLAETGRLAAGELCLLAGVGAGFSWSCAVIEILEPPGYRTAAPAANRSSSSVRPACSASRLGSETMIA
jgi:3-oxoacyl-[acyl-carrier-protein] synthase III